MFRRVENLRMWARNTFRGWVLRSPRGFERRKGWGVATVRIETETLAPGRGAYIAQRLLLVVPTGCRYYRRSPKNVTERSYRYTAPGSVLPGGSGSTDTGSVLPRIARNSNIELISVLPTLCRLYRQFKQILERFKV
jgi:hypothetical protein